MSSLQDGGQSNWSSDNDTDSYGDDEMYDDGEWWGYMGQTLKQIISRTQGGLSLASNTPTLYTFILHGYAKVLTADILGAFLSVNRPVDAKVQVNTIYNPNPNETTDFCQAKE